jgi:hypothetical protein
MSNEINQIKPQEIEELFNIALRTASQTPSSYAFNLFIAFLSDKVATRLRILSVSGALDARDPLTWKNVSSYFTGFKAFCNSHPQTSVVLRFHDVEEVTCITWLFNSIKLERLTRGAYSVAKELEAWFAQYEVKTLSSDEKNAFFQVYTMSAFKGLPTNLRFSLLHAVPETNVKEIMESSGMAPSDMEANLQHFRELWVNGI